MIANPAGFVILAVVIIITPGPDTVLTIANTLRKGRRGGVLTAAGVVSGQLVWALATAVGVAAAVRASQPAFDALKLVGAAYLVIFGARSLITVFRSRRSEAQLPPRAVPPPPLRRGAYFQGLISNLSNPKMAIFFVSLLPQFVGVAGGVFWPAVTLGAIFGSMTMLWLSGYAVAVHTFGDLFLSRRVRQAVDAVAGVALVGLGLRILTDHE
jgi:threonine/homoserine/homoserine lactone efflux protein